MGMIKKINFHKIFGSVVRTIFIFSVFTLLFIIFHHTIKIKKLEKDITVLKEEMSNICDAGMKTVEGLMNNQDGLIEAFNEIQKLKQTQKGMIYH